jgi:solute carrier family 44 (choline transporter-like protein), member 2/4/5
MLLVQGMVENKGRHCTDLPCLLLFLIFWGGMGWVGYTAHHEGDPQKILYGLDSYGNYCGMVNNHGNVTIDLTHATKLYYLNPLELLDASNYYYGRAVCVPECPSALRRCTPNDFPCQDPDQFVCPYYGYSQFTDNGADQLDLLDANGGGAEDTAWWDALPGVQETSCVDRSLLERVPQTVVDAFNATGTCGAYYQMSSLYPGEGPCAAVLFETTDFMHRCYPVISKEAFANVTASGQSVSAKKLVQVRARSGCS